LSGFLADLAEYFDQLSADSISDPPFGQVMHRTLILACVVQVLFLMTAHAANVPPAALSNAPRFSESPNSPYAATTSSQFAADCGLDQASCLAMIGNILMDRIEFSPTSHICLPGITYGDAVAPWLRAHPETSNMSVEDGVFLAITTLYKCGAPNNY
jgi:hypothetical protein